MSTPTFDNPFRESRLGSSEDYRPEWDVPAINKDITGKLAEQIRKAKGRRQPDAGQMISVLLSAPGYGKTHLFGRIGHLLAAEMFFVYVPAFEDVSRPLHHIRRFAVDSLFRSRHGQPSLIARALARLCRSSFLEYVGRFPPSLAARYQSFQQALKDEDGKILEVITAVKDLRPFLTLASSIADRMPTDLSYPVKKALALGWSPAGHLVLRWLKGEPLNDEESEVLGLGEEPAQPLDVLQGIAAILDYHLPMVICCDQMDMVLKKGQTPPETEEIIQKITVEIIEILHRVPNQVLILSCLHGHWQKFKDRSFESFKQRVGQEFRLDDLSEHQAVDLVANRLKGWPGRPAGQTTTWPFDGASLLTYVRKQQPNARNLIQRCAELLQTWSEGGQKGPIYLDRNGNGPEPDKVFLQLWNQELEKIHNDPACNAETYDEARLYRAVKEALTLGRDAKREMAGVRVKNIQEGVIPQGGKFPRYSLKVEVGEGPQSYPLILPVTAINSGHVFRFYFEAMQQAMVNPVAGTLLIHRQSDFQIGQGKIREHFDQEVARGQLRVLALEDDQPTFLRLECLLRFLDDAAGQLLRLGELKLSEDDCRDFILKTSVLDNLDLFKQLAGWRRVAAAQPATSSPPPGRPPVAAAAAGVPVQAAGATTASTVAPQPAVARTATPVSPKTLPAGPGPVPMKTFTAWARAMLVHLVKLLNALGQPVKPVEPDGVEIGPTFARLKIELASARAHFKRICDKADDLRIHLKLAVPPIIESQAGYISVDVQLPERSTVSLRNVLAGVPKNIKPDDATFPVGLDVAGAAHWLNLSDPSDCHLLVAGTTGSGKSEFLRAMVAALATRLDPLHLQFVLVDPKQVTFNLGGDSPFLHKPVARDADQAMPLLEWCMAEMHRRYELLAKQKLTNVGQLSDATLIPPRVVVVIDEFANLLEGKESKKLLNSLLKQIGSMARAAGIHLAPNGFSGRDG